MIGMKSDKEKQLEMELTYVKVLRKNQSATITGQVYYVSLTKNFICEISTAV